MKLFLMVFVLGFGSAVLQIQPVLAAAGATCPLTIVSDQNGPNASDTALVPPNKGPTPTGAHPFEGEPKAATPVGT